ncbi:hypothetical protein BOTNAR_0311g00020 [Botryotinia narcissicola]|uniref:Zn(2)-C6 fungal-type domain-containing protein n=1 Tax=Botryotinia narcissicola TaxID=278944 RepID=A0A4Z1HV80_9HELO|nr:hypothetical protein BOTNAR_0311g00020 [Botryotinia narcissicola]
MKEASSRSEEEPRRLLQQRKQPRTRTSCCPCRARKARWDKASPCENCMIRGYPELCKYAYGTGPKITSSGISLQRKGASHLGDQDSQTARHQLQQEVNTPRNLEFSSPLTHSSSTFLPDLNTDLSGVAYLTDLVDIRHLDPENGLGTEDAPRQAGGKMDNLILVGLWTTIFGTHQQLDTGKVPIIPMANFLVRPPLLCLQTMLILDHVLQNGTKPESAWILLGTTSRMAQSVGMHTQKHDASSSSGKL